MVVKEPLTRDQEQLLVTLLQSHLRYPFDIQLHYKQEISRNTAGKFEEFLSLI
jgi:hypothetical protein